MYYRSMALTRKFTSSKYKILYNSVSLDVLGCRSIGTNMILDKDKIITHLEELSDVKHETTNGDKYYLRKLCDKLNERYDPCNCPDYHHDLAMQLLIKLKKQNV